MRKKLPKKAAKTVRARQKKTKVCVQEQVCVQEVGSKADDAAVKDYAEKYKSCQVTANEVLTAKELLELAGGYEEAFVLLDATYFVAVDKPKASVREAGATADDSEVKEYQEKYEACEAKTRKVLAAEKLVELAGGYDEALTLLDTVVVVMEGKQGHERAARVRGSAAGHHKMLAAGVEEEGGR